MLTILLSSVIAFVITFFAIPAIIRVSVIRGLFDEPAGRKQHAQNLPTLGGLAIFAGTAFSFTFCSATLETSVSQYILAAIIVMFFIGIKDDLFELAPRKKLIGQILAAIIVVFFANIRITSLCGIFGIYQIPYWFSALLSLFTILTIINAYNLIDGIDGLAGGIGAIASFTFGLWFYNYGNMGLCILSVALFSSLIAFLIYNFNPASIFMGDTGSLVVGLILSVLAIKFIGLSFESLPFEFPFRSSPAMAIAILIIPLVDTFRIFLVRIMNGKSPFEADRNHIHHNLLDLGMSHREATLTLYLINIVFITTAMLLRNISSLILLYILLGMATLFCTAPFFLKLIFRQNQNAVKMAE
jgi:UDP-N-acetylmuramyl pentapeptide phosphotransferase/UDP-N-acetylglucosamine-1-phosphate transferase